MSRQTQTDEPTDDATDAQERQVRFMTALAARDVDALNIRAAGRYVIADLPDDEAEINQAGAVAAEFDYGKTRSQYNAADASGRWAVEFAPEVSDE